jgi:hypothetical protein
VLAFFPAMWHHQDVASQPEKVHSSAKNAKIDFSISKKHSFQFGKFLENVNSSVVVMFALYTSLDSSRL